jgi:hypothetical protein
VLRRRDALVLRVVRLKEGPEAAPNQPHKPKLAAFLFPSPPAGQDLPMVVLAFGRFAAIPGVAVIAHPVRRPRNARLCYKPRVRLPQAAAQQARFTRKFGTVLSYRSNKPKTSPHYRCKPNSEHDRHELGESPAYPRGQARHKGRSIMTSAPLWTSSRPTSVITDSVCALRRGRHDGHGAAAGAVTNLAPIALWRPADQLRQNLVETRADLLDRMQRRGAIEPAHLSLIAGISATLAELDRSARTIAAARAVVDAGGEAIRLVLLRDGTAITATEIAPTAAIALASALLDAAGSRLADDLAELRRKNSG